MWKPVKARLLPGRFLELTQLFLTEMPPENFAEKIFTELSGEQDGSAKTQMIRLVMEASQEGILPAQQTADHRQSHGSQRLCHHE